MKTKKLFKKITSMLIAITMVFGLMPMLGQEVAKADTRASEIVADLPNDVQYSLKIGDDEFEGSKEELETFLDELEIPDSVEIKLFLDEDFQEEWEGEEDVPLFALSNIADNQTELANLINNSTFPTIVIKGNQIGTMSSFNIASTINLNTTRVVTLEAFYSGGAWLASNVGTRHFSISSSAMIYFTLVNVQFRGNGIGGGIYNQGVFSITGANTIPGFININTCKAPSGAGISNDSSGVVVLRGNAIIANGEATISGGGVCSHGDRFEIRDSVKIENNTPDNICGSVSDYRVATPEPSPFQLHYNANGGTGSHTEYIYYDEWPHTVWAPEQIGISNGALVLTAWTTNSNGTGLGWRPQEGIWGPEDLISPEGGPPNTTLYAKWATPFPTIVPTTPPTIAPTARPTSAPRPAGIYYHVQNGSKVINGFIAHSVNPTTDVKSKVANTHFEISDWYTNSSFTSSWTTGQGAGTAIDIYAYSNVADNQATLNFLLNRASFGTILIRHENSSAFEFEMEYDAEDGAISGLPPGDPEELFRELGEDAEADIITLTSAIDIGASREVVFRPYSGDVAYIISAIGVRHFDIAKRSPAPSPPATSTPATSKPPESGNPDGPGGDISGIPEEPPEMVGTFIVDLTFRNVQLWGTMKGAGGGGIYNKDATLHLRGTGEFANFANIENCRATNGGGIYNEGTLNLHNRMLISHNTASNQGGGVYNNGKLFMNDNSKIEKNTASAAGGVRNNGSNSVITMNNNATISENTGTFHTGGVYNLGGAFEMRDSSSVADNTSNSYGGGISNSDNGIIILKDTAKIIGNSAATNGGGIWTNNLSKITAEEGVKFADNTAAIPYFLTDQAGIDLHNVQILTTSFSDYGNPFLLLPPFEYAYNNYDINYVDANPPTPYATAAPATTPPSAGPTEAPTPEPGATHQPTNQPTLQPTATTQPLWDFWLTYNANGGTGSYTEHLHPSNPWPHIVLSTAAAGISYGTHTFVEWNTKNDGTGVSFYPGHVMTGSTELQGATTIYAIWEGVVPPTLPPTAGPTAPATAAPTSVATAEPTERPSLPPDATPYPTATPTSHPDASPDPTATPTRHPDASPDPTATPTRHPDASPNPTERPTLAPGQTPYPTETPTLLPGQTPYPTAKPGLPTPFVDSENFITDDHFAYIKGYEDGGFRATNNMTRAEAAVMFARIMKKKMDIEFKVTGKFSDVKATDWFAKEVEFLAGEGVIKGYDEKGGGFYFEPHGAITRAEFAAILARFGTMDTTDLITFSDVKSNHWAYKEIMNAAAKGWIRGYDEAGGGYYFSPGAPITRAEVVTLMNRILGRVFDEGYKDKLKIPFDVSKTHWAINDILETMYGHNFDIVDGKEVWTSLK